MPTAKRSRGRPRGPGKKDEPFLAQVADLLVGEPSLKPTTAMKRVMAHRSWPETDATLIRRWQSKWKVSSEALMNAARERERPIPEVPKMPLPVGDAVSRAAMQDYANSPTARLMQEYANSPTVRLMQEYANSPTAVAMRSYANGATAMVMRSYANSATAVAMRSYANGATAMAMRDHANNAMAMHDYANSLIATAKHMRSK